MNSYVPFFLILYLNFSFAQDVETPYYQKPPERNEKTNQNAFPNLINFDIKYYLNTDGGIKFDFKKLQNSKFLNSNNTNNLNAWWGVNIGQNRNQNYFYELGYQVHEYELNSLFDVNRNRLFFFNKMKTHYINARIKKKLFVIDKVARTTQLNAILAYYQPVKSKLENRGFGKIGLSNISDIESFDYKLLGNKNQGLLELGIELEGKLAERFEIGVFAKSRFAFNKKLNNNFIIITKNKETEIIENYIKGVDLTAGMFLRLNSNKYKKYISKIK